MKNRVMLVNTLSRVDYWEANQEPMIGVPNGLLCVGTLLAKNGFDVVIVDPQVERDFFRRIEQNLEGCLFVGISVMTAGVASAMRISEFVRNINKTIPIVWGGIHPTLFPEQTLDDPLVDIVAWGEGEETGVELAAALGNGAALESVKGIGFKKNGKQVFTERRGFIDLEKTPLTDYGLLDMDKYLYRSLESLSVGRGRAKIAVVHSSRGCPFRCTFCINTHPSQNYRSKSFERLMKEVDLIVGKYDPDVIHLQDDNFFANKQRTIRFFDEYARRGYHFQWFSLARANYFNDEYLSDSFVARLKPSCLWLGLGVESGSARIREMINKGISEEQVMIAARTLGKYGIPAGYAFMVGLPSETEEEMLTTISLMREIKKVHKEAEFGYQYYRPYPGSELYERAVKAGFVAPKSLREWASCQDVQVGYASLNRLPWIDSANFIRYLIFYVTHVVNDFPRGAIWWPYKAFIAASYRLRESLGFWRGCGLEVRLSDFCKGFAKSSRRFARKMRSRS